VTAQTPRLEIDKPECLSQMEAVCEVPNEGVVVTNARHQVLLANSRFLEMTGITSEEPKDSYPCQFYSAQEWDFLHGRLSRTTNRSSLGHIFSFAPNMRVARLDF
jgi:PAS domain-containing protein